MAALRLRSGCDKGPLAMEVWNYERTRRYLLAMECAAAEREGLHRWVEWNVPRFLRTLELIPPGEPGQRCLEVGALPFTFTLLLKKLRPYDLLLVDYHSAGSAEARTTSIVRVPEFEEEHAFVSDFCDLERERLPYADASVDGAVCGEVLEHVTQDPVAMLAEIFRVLRPNGWLVLTTPNVASLRKSLALLHGRNIYDPYDRAFGPTWRHNREYTGAEVGALLEATGFVVERVLVEDAYPPSAPRPLSERLLRRFYELVYRQNYGEQIYAVARRGPVAKQERPAWLYYHEHHVPAAGARPHA